jgi:NAD(P)-dependent dehydrogenase (short-subunit alcohol dehydrogenase family)
MSGQTYISFTEHDLTTFSEASGDRNPLHLNQDYVRRTPYGQPVVFGCLGAMACLGHISLPTGWCATSLAAEFLRPMFVGISYRVETGEKDGRWEARLFDGSTLAVLVIVEAELLHRSNETPEEILSSSFERQEPAVRQQEDMVPGAKVSGVYACNSAVLAAVAERWGVVDRLLAIGLSWSSYLVGMELPGEAALFFKLTLHFPRTACCPARLEYSASVAYSGFNQIKMDGSLLNGVVTVAAGQAWSYIRPQSPHVEKIDSSGVRPASLAGQAVVLIGSSRGLGAAMKRALELRGANVYGIARSANGGDMSRTIVGDGADPEVLRRLRERVSTEHGRLDVLVCSACPPLQPLVLEPTSAARIGSYIDLAVSLTLAPLSEFLGLLNRSDGCAVIISSAAVEDPVKEWPHYVAAKRAVEALGSVASMQYPRVRTLIVRPQKLLTSLTNTPLGHLGAASPALLADRIAARLENPWEPGKTEILR